MSELKNMKIVIEVQFKHDAYVETGAMATVIKQLMMSCAEQNGHPLQMYASAKPDIIQTKTFNELAKDHDAITLIYKLKIS